VKEFVIERVVAAPREEVWKAWTQAERLREWWGPKGFAVTYCKVKLRQGGGMHYCLKAPNGMDMWGKFVYQEIVKPEKLVFVSSFSDEKQNVTRHPLNEGWPLQMMTTVTFEEQGGEKTKITVRWSPHAATEAERSVFDAGFDSMRNGWTGTFEQLEAFLAAP
jgi:uncharacterized protein YndB with AHSA1/START domain